MRCCLYYHMGLHCGLAVEYGMSKLMSPSPVCLGRKHTHRPQRFSINNHNMLFLSLTPQKTNIYEFIQCFVLLPCSLPALIVGGMQICPWGNSHVFVYTQRVCLRTRVPIFCDLSSFWVRWGSREAGSLQCQELVLAKETNRPGHGRIPRWE